MILGANHSSLGRPCFPLSSSCPRGCCLPVLLPVGSQGVSVRCCSGVWALPDTFSGFGSVFSAHSFCSCGSWGMEFSPVSACSLGREKFFLFPPFGCFPIGATPLVVVSWLQALLWCCCPRTCFSLRPHCFSGVLFCPPLLPLESGCFLGLACCLGCVWSLVFS